MSESWRMEEFEHTNPDYPVGVYYVKPDEMFMARVRPQWHDAMEIDLVREGSAEVFIGEDTLRLNAGSAVWINRGHLHHILPADKDCVILSILFHPAYLFENGDSFLAAKYYTPLIRNPNLSYAILEQSDPYGLRGLECVRDILRTNLSKSYGYELETKSYLCALWLQLLEKNNTVGGTKKATPQALNDEERVKEAIIYIHDNYQKAITLDDIAGSIHVSRSECCRCFKRTTGESPFDCLLRHRIYQAALTMQRADHSSVHELALSVGFNNASYFNKIFRKYTNTTPTEYRDNIKKSHRDALSPHGISLARL